MLKPPKGYEPFPTDLTVSIHNANLFRTSRSAADQFHWEWQQKKFINNANVATAAAMQRWEEFDRPMCFVSHHVTEEMQKTDVLNSVSACEILEVFPAMLLGFPKGRTQFPWVMFDHKSEDRNTVVNGPNGPLMTIRYQDPEKIWWDTGKNGILTMTAWKRDDAEDPPTTIIMPMGDKRPLSETVAEIVCESIYPQGEGPEYNEEDQHKASYILSLCLNCVMLMNAYPHVIERDQVRMRPWNSKKTKAHGVTRVDFKLTGRSTIIEQPKSEGGNGRQPYSGWRKAHWRRQRHSERWELQHPEAAHRLVTFRDGTRGHWVRIKKTYVGIKADRKDS